VTFASRDGEKRFENWVVTDKVRTDGDGTTNTGFGRNKSMRSPENTTQIQEMLICSSRKYVRWLSVRFGLKQASNSVTAGNDLKMFPHIKHQWRITIVCGYRRAQRTSASATDAQSPHPEEACLYANKTIIAAISGPVLPTAMYQQIPAFGASASHSDQPAYVIQTAVRPFPSSSCSEWKWTSAGKLTIAPWYYKQPAEVEQGSYPGRCKQTHRPVM
jgi:hypothetical protein